VVIRGALALRAIADSYLQPSVDIFGAYGALFEAYGVFGEPPGPVGEASGPGLGAQESLFGLRNRSLGSGIGFKGPIACADGA